jgi:prepilin-type processing-associated H-X9-DG protein
VVIAIIAILAAILFPVFAKAREKARTSSCQSNMKQFGIAFLQYISDNDETWPAQIQNVDGPNIGGGQQNWYNDVLPYTKNHQVFVCRSTTGSAGTGNTTTYHANGYIITGAGVNESDIKQPANTSLVREAGNNSVHTRAYLRPMPFAIAPAPVRTTDPSSNALNFHMGGINLLYCDGHVKWIQQSRYDNPAVGGFQFNP